MRYLTPAILFCLLCLLPATAAPGVGSRPYEMVWANRTMDLHPPLVDFESLQGWTVEAQNSVASLERSREQWVWGEASAKITYRGTGPAPRFTLRPPAPLPVPVPFDCANFWIYGNNWAWVPDASTPQVQVTLLLAPAQGPEVRVELGRVRWREWWVMHRRLVPDALAALAQGARLTGIEITGGTNKQDRVLYLDNLAFYREPLPELKFDPRPLRGIAAFPGQSHGANVGPGKLPLPTREETILPDNLVSGFKTTLASEGAAYLFRYQGPDGTLVYRYTPRTGTLGDVTARWEGRGGAFQPLSGGGVCFAAGPGKNAVPPESASLLGCERVGESVVARWRITAPGRSAEVAYTFRLWQKSLVVDVKCLGGQVGEVRFGQAVGVQNPRLVNVPYLTFASSRPAVLVTGAPEEPLFTTAWVDFYRSNASELFAVNGVSAEGAAYNGGSRYRPKTDGRRNDCFERLFLTVSPRFEEVLPNLANPKSPWMHVAGERVWRAHGASNRQMDYEGWAEVARYGMTKLVVTDHESGWRDGGESFTLRTRSAPGRGGDESQVEYSRKMRALGFRYGLYTNYTDYAPVNEHWDEDYVTRTPEGEWVTAWPRCYNIKPARAVEMEAKLSPIIKRKFGQDASYCDVHTAVTPWDYCDYDARVPGAGTFAAVLYAYGEIMLNEKRVYEGPVYSEGRQHWYYCGLTDGNYGQDPSANLAVNPWLVDFDLRKLHPLSTNFGMGNPGMFYGKDEGLGNTPAERDARLDRFLAATVAFGHTGFLVREGGIANAARSYFLLQQLQSRYAQQKVVRVRYAAADGRLLDTSAAVATGAYRRSQIATTYDNGLLVVVNGNPEEPWRFRDGAASVDLPPNGYFATFPSQPQSEITILSGTRDGHRADYADTPAYLYADGRGVFTRFPRLACDGPVMAHRKEGGALEVIPIRAGVTFGVSLDGAAATAVALDKAGKEIGPAETRVARGVVYVTPVKGAFSYLLKPAGQAPALTSARVRVVPGEDVIVRGQGEHRFTVPASAKPGERLWQQFEGAWIDFDVVPLAEVRLSLGEDLRLELTSNLSRPVTGAITLEGARQAVTLSPGTSVTLRFPFVAPTREGVQSVKMRLDADGLSCERVWWIKTERGTRELAPMPTRWSGGQVRRGFAESGLGDGSGAGATKQTMTCGGESRSGLFLHPPYKTGVGYVFARFEPVTLPAGPRAAFRCAIGKRDGSDVGDGILFRVVVIDAGGKRTIVAEQHWDQHRWHELSADLSPWAGQTIRLELISDVGTADDSTGDWSCWADMRLETAEQVLNHTLHDETVVVRYVPGPHVVSGLTTADLCRAVRGWVRFQGMGVTGSPPYECEVSLNGIALGVLPEAGGVETRGIWSEERSIPLNAEAIRSLGRQNRLRIVNPAHDYFKVRGFRVDLQLADGRMASSRVDTAAISQPGSWAYAEGIGVPLGKAIEISLPFDLKD